MKSKDSKQFGVIIKNLKSLFSAAYLPILLIFACIVIGLTKPAFWASGNLNNVLFQTAFLGISACGMTMLIASGLIDLSVGGVIAVSSIVLASLLPNGSIVVAVGVALILGLILGFVNGLVVSFLKIPPFIATLGTNYLFLGGAFIATKSQVIPVSTRDYRVLTNSSLGLIPVPFVVFLLLAAVTALIMHRTYFGRGVRAIGSNEDSSKMAGIRVGRTKLLAYVFAGFCFALTAVFMSGRLSSAEANMAIGYEMNVIAAVVVGGTSMRGGKASLSGTVVGALVFAVLANALNLIGVASYWQYVMLGVVLVAAIAVGNRSETVLSVRGES